MNAPMMLEAPPDLRSEFQRLQEMIGAIRQMPSRLTCGCESFDHPPPFSWGASGYHAVCDGCGALRRAPTVERMREHLPSAARGDA